MGEREKVREEFEKTFDEYDFLLSPTMPFTPYELGSKVSNPLQMYLSDIYTVPVNLAGIPSISVPVEPVDGLPVGMQLSGRFDDDATILDLAVAYENYVGGNRG